MRARWLFPVTLLAALMVLWLSVRMWFGTDPRVWVTSCCIAAWAPIGASGLLLWIRTLGKRGDSVAVAWLVRALGMHFVLAWMLGLSDWLRGPPGEPPAWNTDLGAPVVLLSFAPVFALSVAGLSWLASVARRLNEPVLRPAMPGEHAVVPFRGVAMVADGTPVARQPLGPLLVGAAGLAMAYGAHDAPYWVLVACALPLGALTVRNARALVPSIATLCVLSLMLLLRHDIRDPQAVVAIGIRWPWLSLASVGFYLMSVEALLRSRVRHAS